MPEGWVHHYLETDGRGVILIDGVDELREEKRPDVKTKIASWQRSFPSIPIIVTSRPSDEVKASWLDEEHFEHVEVLPLENERVTEFVQNWHSALAEKRPPLKAELKADAENLITEIEQSKTLRELATTPLLLSAICAIHKYSKRQLPANQTDLYEQLVNMLLDRDQQRKLPSSLDKDTMLYYLQKVALWLVRAESSQVDKNTIITFLQNNSKRDKSTNVQTIYKTLIERSGVVREPIDNQLDYVHRTLQEYLAAAEIVKVEVNCRELVNNAQHDFWEKVIEFAGGISGKVNTEFQAQLIKGLMDADKFLLALESVRGAIADNSIEHIRKCAEIAISRLVFEKDIYSISAAGDLALPYLSFEAEQASWRLGLRVKVLCSIGENAYGTLLSYKGCSEESVVQVLISDALRTFNSKKVIGDFIQQLNLKEIRLSNLKSLDGLELITSLEKLVIQDVSSELNLSVLGKLQQLQHLELINLSKISDLSFLNQVPKLKHLGLTDLPQISNLNILGQLPHLQYLELSRLTSITELNVLDHLPHLIHLALWNISKIDNLSVLSRLTKLQHLVLWNITKVNNLSFLSQLSHLNYLELNGFPCIDEFNVLKQLSKLHHLGLGDIPSVIDLSFLDQLTKLKSLRLRNLSNAQNLDSLGRLRQLEKLILLTPSQYTNLNFLSQLQKLHYLILFDVANENNRLEDLGFLAQLQQLQHLELRNLSKFNNLSSISQLQQLQELQLWSLSEISDLSILNQLQQLRHLVLADLPRVSNLNSIGELQRLHYLELWNLPKVSDLSSISHLHQLEWFVLMNLPEVSDLTSISQLQQLKRLRLEGFSKATGLREIVKLSGLKRLY